MSLKLFQRLEMNHLLTFVILMSVAVTSYAQKVTLNLSEIRSNKGQIEVSIYETAQQFKEEKPARYVYFDKKSLKDGKMTITMQLKPGHYGLTFLDDEDGSNGMTFKMGFYPKEGVGFSNFPFKGVSKPKFTDFSFDLKEDKVIEVKFRYF